MIYTYADMPSCFYVYILLYTLACWCNFFNTSQPTFLLAIASIIYLSSLHNRACCGLYLIITVPRLYKLRNQTIHCTTSDQYLFFCVFHFKKVRRKIRNPTPLKNTSSPYLSHFTRIFADISLPYSSPYIYFWVFFSLLCLFFNSFFHI